MAEDDRNIHERRGRIELSKYWPDGSRFRRAFPTKALARQMRSRIEAAIAMKTWQQLKAELSDDQAREDLTFDQFYEIFLEHCRKKNRRCDFHKEEIRRFLPIVGKIRLNQFTRA